MKTIFEKDGVVYKIKFKYKQFDKPSRLTTFNGSEFPTKGFVECYIYHNETILASAGFAFCSVKDSFRKETGRKLSLLRAMKAMGLDKGERRKVWMETYFEKELI